MVSVGVDEGAEGLVGLVVGGGDVDAVEVLEHAPGGFEFGSVGEDFPEAGVGVGVVVAGELQVAGAEDLRFERWPGAFVTDALDAAPDFDHAGREPAGHMEPVEDVGGVAEVLAGSLSDTTWSRRRPQP